MIREVWLNIDSKVVLDKATQRIVITNPEALKNVSAQMVWDRIMKSLGKCEFEDWLSEKIVAATMAALADGSKTADLTEISGATLYINYDFPEENWKRVMSSDGFRENVKKLPIFKVIKETPEELWLEYKTA